MSATTANSGAQDLGSVVCHEFREHLSDVVASVVEACENAKLDAPGDYEHWLAFFEQIFKDKEILSMEE